MAREPWGRRPSPLGRRGLVLLLLLGAGMWAALAAGLHRGGLVPTGGGLAIAERFLAAALRPDLDLETLVEAGEAAWTTVVFAAAAMGLSLLLGAGLGFLASTAWWAGDVAGARSVAVRLVRRSVLPVLYGAIRALIAFMRSVHELLWALVFNAAFGLNEVAAVVAIAIPYGGTMAKVFSEMVDEAPRHSAHALRGAGASSLQVFCFGLVPRAAADMVAYAFYRFECALRASAVLGFFGFLTLGYHLEPAFANARYDRVWTYLYTMFVLVALADLWSGTLRRRLVS
jgi:phosphonate transport system permease protein